MHELFVIVGGGVGSCLFDSLLVLCVFWKAEIPNYCHTLRYGNLVREKVKIDSDHDI